MTYATASDVEKRIPYRGPFTVGSTPSLSTVQAWLAEAEASINNALLAVNLPAPYTATNAVAILRIWVVDYAEGRVRESFAAIGNDPANTDGQKQIDAFKALVDDILSRPVRYGALLGAGSAPDKAQRVRAYVTDNNDGKSIANGDFRPEFRKGDPL